MAAERVHICGEPMSAPLPRGLDNAVLRRARVERINGLRRLRQMPGWVVGETARRQRELLLSAALRIAQSDERFLFFRAKREAARTLDDLLMDYLADCEEALNLPEDDEPSAAGETFSDETAAQARAESVAVCEMVRTPEWAEFLRDICALIRAYGWLLARCKPEDRAEIQAQMDELKERIADYQTCVDRGVDAAEWQRAKVQEVIGRKE